MMHMPGMAAVVLLMVAFLFIIYFFIPFLSGCSKLKSHIGQD